MPIDNLSKITSRSGINTTILLEAGNANVTGIVTAAGFDGPFTGGSGSDINAGIVTAANGLHVGAGGTIIHAMSSSNGYVGINTTTPSYELVVSPTDTNESTLQIKAGGNGKESNVYFGAPDDDDVGKISYDHNGDHMKFVVGTKERVRIRSDNYIGIGTDAITKYVTIKAVHPFVRLEAADTSDKRLDFQVSSAGIATISAEQSSQQLSFKTTGGEALRIDANGKMGLGVTPTGIFDIREDNNPQLTIRSTSHADDGGGRINFAVGVAAAPVDGNTMCSIASTIHSTSGGTLKGDMKFYTNSGDNLDERVNLKANGSIQITPEGSTGNPYMLIDTSGDSVRFAAKKSSGNNEFRFLTQNSGTEVDALTINQDGSLGLGLITPTAGDLATGDSQNSPLFHVKGTTVTGSNTGGEYNLLGRFEAGGDANSTGAMIVLNHSNDRGIALIGGREIENRAYGAIKAIDNQGRLSDGIIIEGGNGAGIGTMKFFTGESENTTERLRIKSDGIIGVNNTEPEGKGIDVSHSRTNGYAKNTDTRNLAHLILRNSSDAAGRFAALSFINGGGTQAEGSINLVQTGNYNGDLTFKLRTSVSEWQERLRIESDGNVGVNTDFVASQSWRSGPRLEIFGGSGNVTGELHLGANRGDGQQSVGSINFFDNTQDTNHKHIAIIEADKVGNTSNKRGGDILFYTKNNNVAAPTEKMRIHNDGSVSIGNNPDVHDDTIFHVQKPSGETNVKFEGDDTMGARLSLHNNDTSASAKNQIDFCDAGGQSTSSIQGFNTDQTNNLGELVFATRNAQGTPPEERIRIESDGQVTITGPGTKYTAWAGTTPLNVNTIAMVNAGAADTNNWGWGLRGNSGDTQWCVERIKDQTSFADVNIKFRVYQNGNYLFAGTDQSDRDIKENILDITGTSLDKIKQLRPRTFNFIESEGYSNETKTGFIAQEVASVIPSITNGTDGQKNMGVDYNGLVAHLVKALQEEIVKREALEARISALEGS